MSNLSKSLVRFRFRRIQSLPHIQHFYETPPHFRWCFVKKHTTLVGDVDWTVLAEIIIMTVVEMPGADVKIAKLLKEAEEQDKLAKVTEQTAKELRAMAEYLRQEAKKLQEAGAK